MSNNKFIEETGKLLEAELVALLKPVYGDDLTDTRDTTRDYYQGTDFVLMGVNVDATCDYAGKDHTTWSTQSYFIKSLGIDIKFGVRTANRKAKFNTPALVVAFTGLTPTQLKHSIEELTFRAAFRKVMKEVMEIGMDEFFNVSDEMGLEV